MKVNQKKNTEKNKVFVEIKYFSLFLLILFCSCNYSHTKNKHTRSFKLTQDSTFIGAWGGTLTRSYGAYIPTSYDAFHIVFIYSKNNKIYVNYEPLVFDTDSTKEKENLEYSLTDMHSQRIENAFDDSYSLESETIISKIFTDHSWYKYIINDDNSLSFKYVSKVLVTEGEIEEFRFFPHYFKTIPNPEDKNNYYGS